MGGEGVGKKTNKSKNKKDIKGILGTAAWRQDIQLLESLAGLTQSIAMFSTSGSKEGADYLLQLPGIVAPTGFFDPAGLSQTKTVPQLKYARESELKHGRVAMLAALGFPFAEEFRPWGRLHSQFDWGPFKTTAFVEEINVQL